MDSIIAAFITEYDGAQDRDRQLANLTSGQYLCHSLHSKFADDHFPQKGKFIQAMAPCKLV